MLLWLASPSGERYLSPSSGQPAKILAKQPRVTVCGRISRQTAGERSRSIDLRGTKLLLPSGNLSIGNLRIFLKSEQQGQNFKSGCDLTVTGVVYPVPKQRNPGGFDSRVYYAGQRIYYLMSAEKINACTGVKNRWYALREAAKQQIERILSETAGEEQGIFRALLSGESGAVGRETKAYYRIGGILHLLAISGLHLSLLGMGCFSLLQKLGLGIRAAGVWTLVLIVCYGLFLGGGVSVVRASLMLALRIGARLLGRCYDSLTALAAAGLLLLLWNPAYLWYSGFLLSFGAVLGLGLFAPAFAGEDTRQRKRTGKRRYAAIKKSADTLGASAGISFMTLPVLLSVYGETSLAGTFLNLFVLPTAGIVLVSGLLGIAAGFLWTPLGSVLLLPGRLLLKLYLYGAKLSARLPFAVWTGGAPQLWQCAAYYLLTALGIRCLTKKRRFSAAFLLLAAVCLLGVRDRRCLRITALDVGQGDAVVWEVPGGGAYLSDGGSDGESQVGTYQILPYLKHRGISRLDGIFVSHSDKDHLSGVRELFLAAYRHTDTLRIRRLYLPDWDFTHPAFRELERLAKAVGTEVVFLKKGDVLRIGEVSVRVLFPDGWTDADDVNGGSLVYTLEYGKFRGIFTGDTGAKQEAELSESLQPCYFLKAAHHGSKNSTSEDFLSRIRPQAAFLSCGENNRYGHPAPETIERLYAAGCACYLTKDSGALTLVTDGTHVKIRPYLERKSFTEAGKHGTIKNKKESTKKQEEIS